MDSKNEEILLQKVLDTSERVAKIKVKIEDIEKHTGVMNTELGETRDEQKITNAKLSKFPFCISFKQSVTLLGVVSTILGIIATVAKFLGVY
jgi:hypothetical protein